MGKTKKNMVLVLSHATRADEKWRAKYQGEIKSQHLSRVSNRNVLSGSSAHPYGERRRREFVGTGGWVDWLDGHEKCRLNFFELCGSLELVFRSLVRKNEHTPS